MDAGAPEDGVEIVDGIPVSAAAPGPPGSDIEPVRPAGQLVAKQAAAIAATGFVAGAATVAAVVRVARGRSAKRQTRKGNQLVQVVASRSFLVDVHLLGPRDQSPR
jgi:hypothetical protein